MSGPRRPEGFRRSRGSSGRGQPRRLKVRLKKKRGRTTQQARWLERQLNDPFVQMAKERGYRSRAAFKLIGIDDEFHILRPGMRVVDLGAAPGGWSQVAAERVRAPEEGRVVAIDLHGMEPIPGVAILHKDFYDDDAPAVLMQALGAEKADVVLSDMAAHATGHRQTDHLRVMALAEAAADFARKVLRPGGAFVAKVLRGGTENELLQRLKRDFAKVRHFKPAASRPDSAELFVVATGFRGGAGGNNVNGEAE